MEELVAVVAGIVLFAVPAGAVSVTQFYLLGSPNFPGTLDFAGVDFSEAKTVGSDRLFFLNEAGEPDPPMVGFVHTPGFEPKTTEAGFYIHGPELYGSLRFNNMTGEIISSRVWTQVDVEIEVEHPHLQDHTLFYDPNSGMGAVRWRHVADAPLPDAPLPDASSPLALLAIGAALVAVKRNGLLGRRRGC